jgi:hypothetical protein
MINNVRRAVFTAMCAVLTGTLATSATASTITLNFDSVNATGGPVDSTAYFASFGVTLTAVTPGTQVQILDDANIYGGAALIPPSAPNMLMQNGSNNPVSFELDFTAPLTSFGFTIPGDQSPSLFPAWQAYAYNGATLLDSETSGMTCCHGALQYTLTGPNITRVVIASQNGNIAGFSGIPLDNLILDSPAVAQAPEPATVTLLLTGLGTVAQRMRRRAAERAKAYRS